MHLGVKVIKSSCEFLLTLFQCFSCYSYTPVLLILAWYMINLRLCVFSLEILFVLLQPTITTDYGADLAEYTLLLTR